jgi:hypothetical protein
MLSESGLPVVFYIFLFTPFAVATVGVARWRSLDTALKVLVAFVTLDGLGTIFATYLALRNVNNLWLTHIFTVIELLCFLFMVSRWQSNPSISWWSSVAFWAFIVVWIACKLGLESWSGFDSYTAPVEKMILMVFATLALLKVSSDNNTLVFAKASFWVLAGILVYCTGSLMLFAAGNSMLQLNRDAAIRVWSTYWMVGCVSNLAYIGALLCRKIQ